MSGPNKDTCPHCQSRFLVSLQDALDELMPKKVDRMSIELRCGACAEHITHMGYCSDCDCFTAYVEWPCPGDRQVCAQCQARIPPPSSGAFVLPRKPVESTDDRS